MQTGRSTGIAALLVLALSASASADAIRVTLHGDGPIRSATVRIAESGELLVRAQEKGKLVWVEALDHDGRVVGRAQSVVGVAETPLYVSGPPGGQKLIVVFEGAN